MVKLPGGTSILGGRGRGGLAPKFASEMLVGTPNLTLKNIGDKYPKFCPLNVRYALERICDFQFMYIIWFLVVYLTYFMKPVKETTFSSKIHKAFFTNIRNDCVFSVIKNKQHSYAIRVWALSS